MKPQFWSNLLRTIAFSTLFAATLAVPARAALSQCNAATMPTGRTVFAVDHSSNKVFVVDASASPINPVCFIAVGNAPTNLAVSPYPASPLLFVENDGDA